MQSPTLGVWTTTSPMEIDMTFQKLTFPLVLSSLLFTALACTGAGSDDTSGDENNGFWNDDSGWNDSGDDGGDGGNCGGSFSGQVSEGVDRFHSFSIKTDRDVVYTLEWDQDTDLDLHLLDSSGNEVTRAETDGGGTGEELDFWTQAGDYQVMVVMWDDEDTEYDLEIRCQ
ncbi:MAG: hypothetical protein ACI9VR_003799 [Cognaticolwellia sp.]|jgi:hypothetical protein